MNWNVDVCVCVSLYIYMQRAVEEKPKSAMYQRNIPVSIKPAQPTKQGFSTNVQLNNHFVSFTMTNKH